MIKMTVLSRLIYRFITIPIKNPTNFSFVEIDKPILKFISPTTHLGRAENNQGNLEKQNKDLIPDIKI